MPESSDRRTRRFDTVPNVDSGVRRNDAEVGEDFNYLGRKRARNFRATCCAWPYIPQMMTETLYNTRILRLAASPSLPRLEVPQASVVRVSPVCGSRVTVDLDLDDAGRVARFGQEVRACALGQAAAALLGDAVLGRSGDELAAAHGALAAYLKGVADDPGDWPGLDVFAPARPYKARHRSILLAFDAAAAAAREAAALDKGHAAAPGHEAAA